MKIFIVASCALMLSGGAFSGEPNDVPREALKNFWTQYAGKTIRRLPVQVQPCNAFFCLIDSDFDGSGRAFDLYRAFADGSAYNCITFSLRCKNDLSDSATYEMVGKLAENSSRADIQTLMDIDPRIARDEFMRRYPDEAQGYVMLHIGNGDGGGKFSLTPDAFGGHMAVCARRDFEPFRAKMASAWAFRRNSSGVADGKTFRRIDSSVRLFDHGPKTVSGAVSGLSHGEEFVVLVAFDLWCADVYAPHLSEFTENLMRRYSKLPIAGAMHDEWGFPPVRKKMLSRRAFWYSAPFAEAYTLHTGGRVLMDDFPLLAMQVVGRERERYAAIDAYLKVLYNGCVKTENDFYEANKRIWGSDVYVTKHATWWSDVCDGEIMHGGLAWWAAKRDWAQSDEAIDLAFSCGMTKLTPGPFWMNEGYGPDPLHYSHTLWRYALCGGRMVYHGIYSGSGKTSISNLPRKERGYRSHMDLLSPDAVLAQSRVDLLSLITRAQIDCPAAVVFGHSRIVNWADSAYKDWGRNVVHALGADGYYVDAYPTSQTAAFSVDPDGRLCVGRQSYSAVWLNHLNGQDAEEWRKLLSCRRIATRIYSTDSPPIPGVVSLADENLALTELRSALAGSTRQTPLAEGLRPDARNRLPKPDGTLVLTDGTCARIKGCCPSVRGDAISGTIAISGKSVRYEAEGIFAVRFDGNGNIDRLAAGGLRTVVAEGFVLDLPRPIDLALVKLSDGWHGLWQTADKAEKLPDQLASLTDKWTRRILPDGVKGLRMKSCRQGALPTVPEFRWNEDPKKPYLKKAFERRNREVEALAGKTVDFVMLGDSLTWNWEVSAGRERYAEVTNEYSVLNLGIPGDRVENLLWRCRNGQLDGYKAKVAMVLVGVNNVWRDSPGEIFEGIRLVYDEVERRQPDASIIVLPVFPSGEQSTCERREKIDALNRLLEREAKNRRFYWMDFGKLFIEPNGTISKNTMHDFVHIGDAGYKIWRDAIFKAARELGICGKHGRKYL